MKFFVDTADVESIAELNEHGFVDGVTTNPSLILASGRDIHIVTEEICQIVEGPVSAEVVASDFETMIREACKLASIASNVCIKLPLTTDGLKACKLLSTEGYKTNVTLCFTAGQALLAAKAGATYISPFIGRIDDINLNGLNLIREIRTIFDNYDNLKTEILAASIRTVNHVTEVAKIGAHVATMPPQIIRSMIDHPLTKSGLEKFNQDWEKTGQIIVS